MSLNYARELLKISLSQLCDSVGFDTTSEIALDILIDVCERQFQLLSKQISNIIQLNDRYQENIFDLLTILFENNNENFNQLNEYMIKYQSLKFSQDIVKFPFRKRNQIYLRIPSKDSQEIIERDQNPITDYIYDWLPLFPDQEAPEQCSSVNIDNNLDETIYSDQQKKIDKCDSHHPLTLLSFLSKNGDETIPIPIGKKANQSLPTVLYRPKRIIEIEAAVAAAEKAKKEQLEKENNEKDQQQGPPPPLRLTIPKPLVVNDKTSLSNKKLSSTNLLTSTSGITATSSSSSPITTSTIITTTINATTTTTTTTNTTATISSSFIGSERTSPLLGSTLLTSSLSPIDGFNSKKYLNSPSSININSSINIGKKNLVSPPLNNSNELKTDYQSNSSIHSLEISSNNNRNEETALDLTKKSQITSSPAKLPTLKLNIKNVPNPQLVNNSENPTNGKKQTSKTSSVTKQTSNNSEKVNLKIRTSSLQLFNTNDNNLMTNLTLNNSNENRIIYENKQIDNSIQSNLNSEQRLISNEINLNEIKQKKKKKKSHNDQEEKKEKKFKKEEENNSIEIQKNKMDIDNVISSTTTNTSITNQPIGGTIRLKIKLGKPTNSINNNETNKSDDKLNLTNTNDNIQNIQQELKTSPIRLTLPVGTSNSSTVSTHPSIISTINRSSSQKRKSGKVKRVPQSNDQDVFNSISSSLNSFCPEENTVSIDDLPLGERTSPNKTIVNNIQTNLSQPILSTPMKKKSNTIKKRPNNNNNNNNNNKRTNNIVGVAVIEERRIDHDSQEKIWICPSCNRPDNGQEAMIACDLCDDWYHWECVGIVEEPPESIPWFCPKCHRSNSSTTSAQQIKPSTSSKTKRKRASAIYQQQKQQQQTQQD